MKEKMLQTKTKLALIIGLFLLVGALAWWIFKVMPAANDSRKSVFQNFLDSKSETQYDAFSEKAILFEEDKVSKMDLVNGKMEDATQVEQSDFSGFEGLPFLGFKEDEYLEISNVLTSKDKRQAIVQITAYEKKGEDEVNPDAVKSVSAYVCQLMEKKCTESNILSQQYEGLDPSLLKDNPFIWTNWDPQKNIILGNFLADIAGHVFYVCNTVEKKCNGVGKKDENSSFEVPFGAVNPDMKKFVLIKRNNDSQLKAELYLYLIADTSQPIEKINVSSLINDEKDGFENISSISWSRDGKIAIGLDGGIFLLDTEKKSLSLVYSAPIDEEGDYFWNSSDLYLSPDASFIAFVDSDSWLEDEDPAGETSESVNNLKKIDLKTNEVSTLYSTKGLTMYLR